MQIICNSIHTIDHETPCTTARTIPEHFNTFLHYLFNDIALNENVRNYKTKSNNRQVIGCALMILEQSEDKELVAKLTKDIADKLLEEEIQAQEKIDKFNKKVQKGMLVQALLYDEIDNSFLYLLAKVENSTFVDAIDFTDKHGFNKDKKSIWKSCLIDLKDGSQDEYYAKIYSNTTAKFWSGGFLELTEMADDETNTLNAFGAIEATLNRSFRGKKTLDYSIIRNSFVSYFLGHDYIDFDEMVRVVFDEYEPIDIDKEKCDDIKNKILELPEKRKFDHQFNSVRRVIKARIKKVYPVTKGIELKITEGIEKIAETIIAYRDEAGEMYLRVKMDNEETFNQFKEAKN